MEKNSNKHLIKKYKKVSFILMLSILITVSGLTFFYSDLLNYKNLNITLNDENQNLDNILNTSSLDINELIETINSIKYGDKYKLHDPSFSEVIEFLSNDKTDENNYSEAERYSCIHFSRDINNISENLGIRCAYVVITMTDTSKHAIVAFNTSDKGIVYFEPQTDEQVLLEKGKDYWKECLISSNLEKYPAGSIIESYILYW